MPPRAPSGSAVTRGTRLQVLNPFIAELQNALGASPKPSPDSDTVRLCVSGRELTVDAWTSERLDPTARAGDSLEADCRRVVTQSVALLAKCGGDLFALEGQEPRSTGGLYMARAEVMLDAAIGGSLVKDVQCIVDDLLKAGRFEEANGLSRFNHQLRNTVYELRKRVDPEYRSTIEDLAERLAETGAVDTPEVEATEAEPPGSPSTAPSAAANKPSAARPAAPGAALPLRRHRGTARRSGPRPGMAADAVAAPGRLPTFHLATRTKVLAILFLVTSFLLFIALLPALFPARPTSAPPIDVSAYPGVVRGLEDRWPGLYITIESAAWDGLEQSARIELLHELTGGLTARRYKGAFLRTPEGRPLGQWLWNNGVSLLDDGAELRDRPDPAEAGNDPRSGPAASRSPNTSPIS